MFWPGSQRLGSLSPGAARLFPPRRAARAARGLAPSPRVRRAFSLRGPSTRRRSGLRESSDRNRGLFAGWPGLDAAPGSLLLRGEQKPPPAPRGLYCEGGGVDSFLLGSSRRWPGGGSGTLLREASTSSSHLDWRSWACRPEPPGSRSKQAWLCDVGWRPGGRAPVGRAGEDGWLKDPAVGIPSWLSSVVSRRGLDAGCRGAGTLSWLDVCFWFLDACPAWSSCERHPPSPGQKDCLWPRPVAWGWTPVGGPTCSPGLWRGAGPWWKAVFQAQRSLWVVGP